MPITNIPIQITFSGANSYSLLASASIDSDSVTLTSSEVKQVLMAKSVLAGAISGDSIDIILLEAMGDPDDNPDIALEYTSPLHSVTLGALDTFIENTAKAPIKFKSDGLLKYKLRFVSNAVSTIVISCAGRSVSVT